ncbi:FG-GAP repeat domain-containing protein [Pelagicoccus mobilis]|uniref:VCBS repeat-containing protein n=1 Tax=Pelagicoccus mobilis TaxID=415221 RepID=A0A934S5E0_9BACT|nr:VCBS repeat-containing protein [Pelagicoccus mobilis]MBK1879714.1 VCBS repeat-containing protein [Pelagicoccus mobilis]
MRTLILPVLSLLFLAACSPDPQSVSNKKSSSQKSSNDSSLSLFTPEPIGREFSGRPWITDLAIVDLDKDGLLDVLICEGKENRVAWVRQSSLGVYEEQVVGDSIQGPAHVEAADIDLDGDLDILVASMGVIFPNNQRIGSVIVLEQTDALTFEKRVLAEGVDRVTDVQAADLDLDGDMDLSIAKFGYDQGEISWMENLGNWEFKDESLLDLSGGIHAPVADFDSDGLPDIAALVSQEWEEIHVFRNQGEGTFDGRSVYGSANEDYGSSGIAIEDLNRDGLPDILYSNGDAFDYAMPGPRPWHGVQWLENRKNGYFKFHRIGELAGAYSPIAVDIDEDGDLDVVAVSGFNFWDRPNSVSMAYFENDGAFRFTMKPLARTPTHLIVVEAADMDQDGKVELVTGSFHAYPPYEKIARLTLWDR